MGYIVTLLFIILLSLIINRTATVALVFIGLSRDMARFQARSAFSTVGYTTSEAEHVMHHPARRQIVSLLMLLGNAGMVSTIAVLRAGLTSNSAYSWVLQLGVFVGGVATLWGLATSKWVDRHLTRIIRWALRNFTQLQAHDFIHLMHLSDGYSITAMELLPGGAWWASASMKCARAMWASTCWESRGPMAISWATPSAAPISARATR